jgi:hypothetical protein
LLVAALLVIGFVVYFVITRARSGEKPPSDTGKVSPPPSAPTGGTIPPSVQTGGGIYVSGDVHIHDGDFVGRDQIETEDTRSEEKDDSDPSG